jgi:hypothetical protein
MSLKTTFELKTWGYKWRYKAGRKTNNMVKCEIANRGDFLTLTWFEII